MARPVQESSAQVTHGKTVSPGTFACTCPGYTTELRPTGHSACPWNSGASDNRHGTEDFRYPDSNQLSTSLPADTIGRPRPGRISINRDTPPISRTQIIPVQFRLVFHDCTRKACVPVNRPKHRHVIRFPSSLLRQIRQAKHQ